MQEAESGAIDYSYWSANRPTPVLTLSDLLPGDVLLFRSLKVKPHQGMISRATDSPYTHAALYLGGGEIGHSVTSNGVTIDRLQISPDSYIGVLRSQLNFTVERMREVRSFLDSLIARKSKYDWPGVISLHPMYKTYFERIVNNFTGGSPEVFSLDELSRRNYFCSALIVACWFVNGMLDKSTWGIYKPDNLSPGDLHRDVTFGWLLGYLAAEGVVVPEDDPLRSLTQWSDIWQIEKEEAVRSSMASTISGPPPRSIES